MSGALDDIQLNIVVNLQGDPAVDRLIRKLGSVARAADEVVRKQDAQVGVNRRAIRSWEDLTRQLSAVEQKFDAMFRAGVHMTQMGHDLIGVSQRIVGLGAQIVDTYADYDFTLRRAAVALNTNQYWQGKLNEAIIETSQVLGVFKPEDVATAYYRWGAASGVVIDSQEDLATVTETVQKILTATAMAGGSLEGNILGVYSVLSQFNMEADKAGYVTEVLALMTERTAADFGDLTNSLSYLGPLADSIGITFEDVAQILGVLADAGQRGSRAGRGLSMVIEGISAPSGPAKEALDGLIQRTHGLSASWESVIFPNGEFLGLRDMINEVAKAAEGMTDAERGRFFATALSNNATRALIPLITEQILLNKEAAKSGAAWVSVLDQEKYSLEDAAHFYENMSDQMQGSIKAVVGSLRNTFFPILQLVAVRIMEMATPIIDKIKLMADAFGAWLKQNPEMVDLAVKIGALVAAASAIAGVLFLVSGTITLLIANLGNFALGIGRVITPFASLILVIGGLVTLITSNFGGIRTAFEDLGDAISEFMDALSVPDLTIQGILGELWKLIEPKLEEGVRKIADAIHWLADQIRRLSGDKEFMAWASEAVGWLGALIVASAGLRILMTGLGMLSGALWAFRVIWSGVTALLMSGPLIGIMRGIGGVMKGLYGAFMALSTPLKFLIGGLSLVGLAIGAAFLAYETNFAGFRDFVNGIISWLVTTIPQVISNVMAFFAQAGTTITGIWQTIVSVVGPILQGFIAPFVRLATEGIPALIRRFQEFWAAVAPIFASIRDTVVEVFTNVIMPAWDGVMAKIQEFVGFVVPLITDFVASFIQFATDLIGFFFAPLVDNWDMIVGTVGIAAGIILGFITEMVELILGVVGPWIETMIRIVGVLWETVTGLFKSALDIIMGIFQTVFGTLSEIFKAFSALFRGDLSAFWEHVTGAFWTAIDGILRIVGGLVSGIWTAFTGMVSTVWELVTGFLSGILGLFPKFIQDIIAVGGDIVRGLWQGISGLAKWVWEQISGFVGGIVDKVKNFFGIKSPSTIFADIGKNIVRGIWQGISGLAQWLWDKVSGWVGDMIDNVLDFFGIESPSKVFADIGENIVKGLAVGVETTPDALNSLKSYSDQLLGIGESTAFGLSTTLGGVDADLNATSSAERFVRVELDITSSDGSVGDIELEKLKAALTGSDLVRALEHMAEAG